MTEIKEKYERWTVLKRDYTKNRVYYICECECGNIKSIRLDALKCGQSKSCGCLCSELSTKRGTGQQYHLTHGLTENRFYKLWWRVKDRCFNPKCKSYHRYGGRGITLYPEWIKNPVSFVDYVSKLPNSDNLKYSIDRIDNDGNYEPGNLRWASQKTQTRNSTSAKLTYEKAEEIRLKFGDISASELSRAYNIDVSIIYDIVNYRLWRPDNE